MKLCKDCIYFVPALRCKKQPDLVTGGEADDWRGSAKLQREDDFVESIFMRTCGIRGRWFKEKAR